MKSAKTSRIRSYAPSTTNRYSILIQLLPLLLLPLVLLPASTIAFNCVPNSSSIALLQQQRTPATASTSVLYQESPKSASAFWKDLNLSRRDAAIFSIGGVVYGKLIGDVLARVLRGDHYPKEHERYVSTTFEKTITAAATNRLLLLASSTPNNNNNNNNNNRPNNNNNSEQPDRRRPLRVLEVGIGSTCRTVISGMYDEALAGLSASQASSSNPSSYPITGIDITGADIYDIPKPEALRKAQDKLTAAAAAAAGGSSDLPPPTTSLNTLLSDITATLPFPDGYFDAVTCSLLLCSVAPDQEPALNEIKRLLNPNGGVFGYVEHVAVNKEERSERSFLEWQQRTLDPLQRLVAHNCHLHRETEAAVRDVFGAKGMSSRVLYGERFFVDDMWPVSCQCCGVIALESNR